MQLWVEISLLSSFLLYALNVMNRMGIKSAGLKRDLTEVDYSEHCLDLPFLNQ